MVDKGNTIKKDIYLDPEPEGENKIPSNDEITVITENVVKILEISISQEMIELRKKNKVAFEKRIESLFPDFVLKYYRLYQILMDETNTDINHFFDLLKMFRAINNKEVDEKTAYKDYGKKLNEQYVFSRFGGEDQFNKKMEELKKEKNNEKIKKKMGKSLIRKHA